jgi:DNA-binding IclR family transcriptional regulator/AraC-like DNA-binding protein
MLPKELIPKSKDIMRNLESQIGETIGLGGLDPESGQGTVLAVVVGTSGFAYHLEVNYHFPLHTSVPGKAILAYLPPEEREVFLARMDFKRFTPTTIIDRCDFEDELASVTEKGYAIDVSEQLEGCHCVGVPVFDAAHRVVAGLWATGPSAQLPVRNFGQVAELLRKGSAEITVRISSGRRSMNRNYIVSVVDQAREIMNSQLHQSIDVQQLSANLYVSYSWFRKVFKEQTGEAPAEYHLNRRLQKAGELLRGTDLSIRRISEELGFKSQNHFSALFKRKIGHAPSFERDRSPL